MDEFQLNLFSGDVDKLERGYEALAALDFKVAREIFSEVLSGISNHPSATKAIKMAVHWEQIIQETGSVDTKEAPLYLWDSIKRYPFGKEYGSEILRKALIGRLTTMIDENPLFYIPPDLCLGYLYLQTGCYLKAESALQMLIETDQSNGRLMAYLGDALFMQGRKGEARVTYARALLLAPGDISPEEMKDNDLVEVIRKGGAETAPIQGWFKGVLPLLDLEKEPLINKGNNELLNTYDLLSKAETARWRGRYVEMNAHRNRLRENAPDIFDTYMKYITGRLL